MSGTFRALKAFIIAAIALAVLPAQAFAEGVLVCGIRPGDGAVVCALNFNHPTAADARSAGLAACAAAGLFNCSIPATFRNTCYAHAFAHWGGGWGANGGHDVASAQRAAMSLCQRHSAGVPCTLHATVCDTVDEQEVAHQEQERLRAEAEARAQKKVELDETRERLRRKTEEDNERAERASEAYERRLKADMAYCFDEGDRYGCSRALLNPALPPGDRARVEQRHQGLLRADHAPPLQKQVDDQPAPASRAAARLQILEACERYDLTACHRISRTPLADLGTGISASLDEKSKHITRFNRALADAQTFATYVNECAQKKRMACDAALGMPAISDAHRTRIVELQAALPWYSLDDPKHFMWTLVALPFLGYLGFLVLARRSPANMPARPLDRLYCRVRDRIPSITFPSLFALRAALAHIIAPAAQPGTAAPAATPEPVQPEVPRDPESARAALQLVHAYLGELPDDVASEVIANPETAGSFRNTLALAAKQLDIAQRADPTANLTIDGDDSLPLTLTQQWLRARAVQLEALTWCATKPRREIQLLTQATQIDPTFAPAFHSLGVAHFLSRNRTQAVAALERACALDPSNIEARKALDRARHMTDAEIATYKLSNVAARTASAGVRTWNVMKLIWIFGLPLAIVLIVAQFMGSVTDSLKAIFALFVMSAVFVGLRRLKDWFDNS